MSWASVWVLLLALRLLLCARQTSISQIVVKWPYQNSPIECQLECHIFSARRESVINSKAGKVRARVAMRKCLRLRPWVRGDDCTHFLIESLAGSHTTCTLSSLVSCEVAPRVTALIWLVAFLLTHWLSQGWGSKVVRGCVLGHLLSLLVLLIGQFRSESVIARLRFLTWGWGFRYSIYGSCLPWDASDSFLIGTIRNYMGLNVHFPLFSQLIFFAHRSSSAMEI